MRVLALALALATTVRAPDAPSYPVPASPPRWSWDALGSMAFAHVCQPTAFNTTQLEQLKRYNFVQFDKQMNTESMPYASQEDRFIAAARQVKSVNADAKVLLYLNGLINFPAFQRLYNATLEDPTLLLVNASGARIHLLPSKDGGVFDVRLPAMRKLFVADTQYAMASGAVDGVTSQAIKKSAIALYFLRWLACDSRSSSTARTGRRSALPGPRASTPRPAPRSRRRSG